MLLKKAFSLLSAGALVLVSSVPAFAFDMNWGWNAQSGDRNYAYVESYTSAYSNTGGNTQNDMVKAIGNNSEADMEIEENTGSRYISTGDAEAHASATVVANSQDGDNNTNSGGWNTRGYSRFMNMGRYNNRVGEYNRAEVHNDTVAMADSGYNEQDNTVKALNSGEADMEVEDGSTGDRTIETGNAFSSARTFTLVNSRWSRPIMVP